MEVVLVMEFQETGRELMTDRITKRSSESNTHLTVVILVVCFHTGI